MHIMIITCLFLAGLQVKLNTFTLGQTIFNVITNGSQTSFTVKTVKMRWYIALVMIVTHLL